MKTHQAGRAMGAAKAGYEKAMQKKKNHRSWRASLRNDSCTAGRT